MAAELAQLFIEPLEIGNELGLPRLQLLHLLPISTIPLVFQEKTGAVKLILPVINLRLQVIGQSLTLGSSDVLANRELPFVYSFYGH